MYVRAVAFLRALHGICGVDRDGVLIHVIVVHMMEMAIMKVIHMAVMVNRSVLAIRTVLMSVVRVVFLRCVYRKPKPGRSDDEVRPRLGDKECVRRDRRRARPVHLSPGIDARGSHCNTSCNRAAGDEGGAR